jgi:polyvinyl alcohol dehydrogenase (cytochrome)
MRIFSNHRVTSVCVIVLSLAAALALRSQSNETEKWTAAGQNIHNTRAQANERRINKGNVASLKTQWTFTTGGDVSATPTVADDAVYFPDWSGNLYAVRRENGKQIWSHKISDYDNYIGSISRVSPAIHGDDLIIGDLQSGSVAHNGASIIAINRHTGTLKWITQVSAHPAAIITGSPVIDGDIAYVGVASRRNRWPPTPPIRAVASVAAWWRLT